MLSLLQAQPNICWPIMKLIPPGNNNIHSTNQFLEKLKRAAAFI